MASRLSYSKRALADIESIFEYIGADDRVAARRFTACVRETSKTIVADPRAFPLTDWSGSERGIELRRRPLQRPFDKYMLFYRPGVEGVEVVRVLHGARDLDVLLNEPER
ncbi:type II toxin-antitoxin system RelE/ParE family toxin [Nannocystaceae bacterium ST9]